MIAITGLSKSHGGSPVFSGVSLTVPDGAAVAVTGPSGSGKTTLLRLVAGLDRPDGGTIAIDGRLASSRDILVPPSGRSVGFVFQSPALWPHMTVAENISYGLWNLPPDAREERLGELLRWARIAPLAGRYPHEISGGEAQRVSLLRAIAPRPRHLLMDEPLANLDDELRGAMIALIRSVLEAGGVSLVYVTHRRDEAELVAEKTYLLKGGSLREI